MIVMYCLQSGEITFLLAIAETATSIPVTEESKSNEDDDSRVRFYKDRHKASNFFTPSLEFKIIS